MSPVDAGDLELRVPKKGGGYEWKPLKDVKL
jgi:hypothetical protein